MVAPPAMAKTPSTDQVERKVLVLVKHRGGPFKFTRYVLCDKTGPRSWSCDMEVSDAREESGSKRYYTTARYTGGHVRIGAINAY
jgi:hypothetical protein